MIHSLTHAPSLSPVHSLSHSHQMFLSLTAVTQRIQATTGHSSTSPPPPLPPIPVPLLPPHHLASQPLKSAILTAHGKKVVNPIVPAPEQISNPSADKGKKKEVNNLNIVVKNERDWNDLNNQVDKLVIDEGVCNDMKGDLVIENLNCLKSILVKKNSMKNLNSLKIRNCKLLEKIETKDGGYETGSFFNVKSVELSRLLDLIQLI